MTSWYWGHLTLEKSSFPINKGSGHQFGQNGYKVKRRQLSLDKFEGYEWRHYYKITWLKKNSLPITFGKRYGHHSRG